MLPFEFYARTRFVVGAGQLKQLGNLASELGARRVLLVSDPGIRSVGHTARAEQLLQQAGIHVTLFDAVRENPTSDDVELGCKVARRCEPECIIGLGGGSSMDCAKGINFVYSNGGRIHDYWGVGKALRPMLPMIAVPTTAGTGSEAQSFALISDAETHVKMACGDKKASFRIALLDPELTMTQPPRVTALTGIDALSHALETYVTRRRNPISQLFSREAWRLLANHLPRVMAEPNRIEIRAAIQWGACLAGLAIENSMLGAAHALANPLTARFGIPHGQAVAVMLPEVIRANWRLCAEDYEALLADLPTHPNDHATDLKQVPHAPHGPATTQLSHRSPSAPALPPLAQWVQQLVSHCGLQVELRQLTVEPTALVELGAAATQQWTGQFNPCSLNADEYTEMYQNVW